LEGLEEKAKASGACQLVVKDLQEEFVKDYVFPCLRAGAVYERKYLLGTSMARPVIAKVFLLEVSWRQFLLLAFCAVFIMFILKKNHNDDSGMYSFFSRFIWIYIHWYLLTDRPWLMLPKKLELMPLPMAVPEKEMIRQVLIYGSQHWFMSIVLF